MFRAVTLADAGITGHVSDLRVELRVPRFIGGTASLVSVLANSCVLVVGLGAIGRPLAMHLGRLGVAKIYLVDSGHYDDDANLVTQDIDRAEIDGRSKASSVARAVKRISPGTHVEFFEGRFQNLDIFESLRDVNFAFLATDNLPVEVAVGQACLHLAIPLIQASVHGETLVTQIRLLTNAGASGPCLACFFSKDEWELVSTQTQFSCSGPALDPAGIDTPPTVSTSFLCGHAATLAMTQFTRHQLDIGKPVGDSMLQYCGFTHRMTHCPIARDATCRCDHTQFARVALPAAIPTRSLRELAAASRLPAESGSLSFQVGGLAYVETGHCSRACGGSGRIDRFVELVGAGHGNATPGSAVRGGIAESGVDSRDAHPGSRFPEPRLGSCPTCGSALVPDPFFTWADAPAGVLFKHLDRPLAQIGAAAARWVVVRGAGQGTLLHKESDDARS